MRVIIARLVWNFDMSLAHESEGWMEKQRVFNFWEKPPLKVHMKPVVR